MKHNSISMLMGGLLVAGISVSAHAEDSFVFGANIGVESNHLFRGQPGDVPTVSGGADLSHESGVYVGIWTINAEFDPGTGREYGYERDLYAGFRGSIDDFGYDIGILDTAYPRNENWLWDNTEAYVKAAYGFVAAEFAYQFSADDANNEGTVYYALGAGFEVVKDVRVKLTVGHYDYPGDSWSEDYDHAQLDLTKNVGDLGEFTLTLSQTEEVAANGLDGDERLAVKWTKSFY